MITPMFALFKKEMNSFFNSLVGYLAIIVFLILIGLFTWVFPDTSVLEYGFADMGTLFSMGPYVFLFLIPAITMKSFAEEKRTGTLEWLLTKPIKESQVIFAKYAAAVGLLFISLVPTFVYYISLYQLGNPTGNIDTAGVIGSYIGLFLLGAVFTSIGIFSSTLTESQIVAFILSAFLCFFLYEGLGYIAMMNVFSSYAYLINPIGISYHYNAMSKGLIHSNDLIYFLSVIALMFSFTQLRLSSRKW